LDKNTTSKDKSPAKVSPHKKRKTDRSIEKNTKKKTEKAGKTAKKSSEEAPPEKNVDDKEKTDKSPE